MSRLLRARSTDVCGRPFDTQTHVHEAGGRTGLFAVAGHADGDGSVLGIGPDDNRATVSLYLSRGEGDADRGVVACGNRRH